MARLEQENRQLREQLAASQNAYSDLRQRALKAYNEQKAKIEELERLLGGQ